LDLEAISEKDFSVAVRGWNRDEVRSYLTKVAASFVPVRLERDELRRKEAEQATELARLRDERTRLEAESEGYRAREARFEQQEFDVVADIGGQVTVILQAAAAAGAQIRENAERHAARLRREALDKAATIDREGQAVFGQIAMARQELIRAAEKLRSFDVKLVTAAEAARSEVLRSVSQLDDVRGQSPDVDGRKGTEPDQGKEPAGEMDELLRALRLEVQRPGWPLPAGFDSTSSILDATVLPAEDSEPGSLVSVEPGRPDAAPPLAAVDQPPASQAPQESLQVAVIGAGYVGLTTAACLAHLGHSVVCTDRLADRVAQLIRGVPPFYELGLEELLGQSLATGRLSFGGDNIAAVAGADIVLLCLPTPEGADGRADVAALEDAARKIGPHLAAGAIVVDKSTAPVGSCRSLAGWLGRPDVAVVSNPEFLREGSALDDFLRPDRVVIGADDPAVAAKVSQLYQSLDTEILTMRPKSAELVKYASNGFLATKLSYSNCIATLCELVDADVGDVLRGMGSDRRIGPLFLAPGPGWGGSCFPKDTDALVRIADDAGFDFKLLREVVASNRAHEVRLVDRIVELAGGSVEGRTVAMWGLTFKAHTDDRRESPSLAIAHQLTERGARVQAYDPTVHGPVHGLTVRLTPVTACEHAVVLFVATEWEELRHVDLSEVSRVMDRKAILDGRDLLDADEALANGFVYAAVGRPLRIPTSEVVEVGERSTERDDERWPA
jgi:UDPglucose 6-dehydrogenase